MMSQDAGKDFFISYTRADRTWAEWIAFQLEEAGYTTILQAWDFRPGSNFVLEMDTAARIAIRTIAVLSPDYFQSGFTPSEWATAFRRDPKGEQHLLVPVQVQPCDVEGLLGSIIYINLVSLEEQEGRTALLEGVRRERAKPSSVPFPREARGHTPPAFPKTLPSVWTVPYRRNPYFTGREDELAFLANGLSIGGTLALTQSLSGLGGIGKTQLAVEYAYRFRDRYDAVLWVSADSRETLITGCVELAAGLKLPEQEERDQNKIVTALQRWLGEQQGWLLILDNVEDMGLATWFLPVQHQGAALLTTRRQVTEPVAQTMAVDSLPEGEGALFLLRRTKFLPLDGSLDKATEADSQSAYMIAHALGGLPLALDQAGAYILETGCDLATYLALYQQQQRQSELLQRRGSIPSDHPLSVTATFTLIFEEVRRRSEVAIELLRLCAFLAPDAIAEEIISGGTARFGRVLQPVAADTYRLNEVIEILHTFSLIKRDPVDKLLNIHRLVQAVLQNSLKKTKKRLWAKRAVLAVNAAFPHPEYRTWVQCERLLPHALQAAHYIKTDQITGEEAGHLLHETALYLWNRARYPEAEPLYWRALLIREQALGPEHPHVAYPLSGLANLYREQGKYEQAEPLLQRALCISEQQLGPEHPGVAESLDNLAILYAVQGKFTEAEPLYQRALRIWEQQLGPEHPNVAITLIGLATLYREQGKYAEAEALYQRALHIREQQLGLTHPDTAETMHDLARLREAQGNSEEARTLYARALAIREQALVEGHSKTTETRKRLAALLHTMGQHEEATQLEAAQAEQGTKEEERETY